MNDKTRERKAKPFILKTALCLWILTGVLWVISLVFGAGIQVAILFSLPLSPVLLLLDNFMQTPFEGTVVLGVVLAANALVQAWFVWRFATIRQRRMTQP
jgi:hypothetical protein